jgi:hypothetical protein
MPKHPIISIPLDIPDARVLQTELTKDGEFILTVESTLTSTTCRHYERSLLSATVWTSRECCATYPFSDDQSICAFAQSASTVRSVTTIQPPPNNWSGMTLPPCILNPMSAT